MALTIDSGEYRSAVGLKDLYIAEVTQDDSDAYVADTPEYFAPAVEASQEAAVNRQTQYADDQPFDAMSSEGETTISLTVTNIPLEMLAKLCGREFDPTTGRMYDNTGTPPYFALSFRSQKSNGSYRYYQFLKGRFDMPSEDKASKTDSPAPKTIQIKYTAIKTIYVFDLGDINDSIKRVVGDEDTLDFDGDTWFSQVQTPDVASPSPIALSSITPADGASNQLVSVNIVLVFNNALLSSSVNNISLVRSDTYASIACTKTLSTDKKTVTLNPDDNLTASKTYLTVLAGVTDIYGQLLADVTKDFATAA
jgi:phi13 family phage major tail protein